ncbi:MAG: DUF488 domain-containing protein [Euryarchaeota archaeon]|nr:DUF488 domain-containing protein [Euryarchaeota archaeon]
MPAESRYPQARTNVAFTITTADSDSGRFFADLAAHDVDTLIDIRPETDRTRSDALARRARAEGLDIVRISALAPPKSLPHPPSGSGAWVTFRDRYGDHLKANDNAFQALKEKARESRVALVCDCADPSRCHRGILAERLVRAGVPTTHLFPGLKAMVSRIA